MENRYKFTLDLKNRVLRNIKYKQGDTDSSVLEINLVDNGLAVDITDQTIQFNFLKSDGTTVIQDASTGVSIIDSVTGNFQCILKNNTLAAPGIVLCEIEFSNAGKILSTTKFNFTVESSIGSGTLSTNYIGAIETQLAIMGTATASANTAATNANTAKDNANTAEALRVTAEGNRVTEYQAMINTSKMILKNPVSTYSAIVTTYPAPQIYWTVRTIDDGKLYRYDGTVWVWIDTLNTNVYDTVVAELAQNANNYNKFIFPDLFTIADEFKVDLFKYGQGYNTNFDIKTKKIINGGKTYYVSTTGLDTNDGLTIGTPLKGIDTAIAKSDVQTIILLQGNYFLTENFQTQLKINKSINIIGKGTVRIINGVKPVWNLASGKTLTYQSQTLTATEIIDFRVLDSDGDYLPMTVKASSTDTELLPHSFAIGSTAYVHTLDGLIPTIDVACLSSVDTPVLVTDSVGLTQVKLYIENIEFIGGRCPFRCTTQTTIQVHATFKRSSLVRDDRSDVRMATRS